MRKSIFLLIISIGIVKAQNKPVATILSNVPILLNQISPLGDMNMVDLVETNIDSYYRYQYTTEISSMFYFVMLNTNEFLQFIAIPNDTIFIDSNSTKTNIKTVSKDENSLFLLLNKSNYSNLFWSDSTLKSYNYDFVEYKRKAHEKLNKNEFIINKFKENIRPSTYKILMEATKLELLDQLLMPYNKCNNPDFFPENNPDTYFSEIDSLVKLLPTLSHENMFFYGPWLNSILKNYANYSARGLAEEDKLRTKFKAGLSIFSGYIKDVYLTKLMLDKAHNESMEPQLLDMYFLECKQSEFKEKVQYLYQSAMKRLKEDVSILNTTLKDINNEEITWEQLLFKYNGKPVYIDFWASWCAGCKQSIPDVKSLKVQFPDLHILFISIDVDENKWKYSLNTWGHKQLGSQYLLNPASPLASLLAKPSIPRYTLIDSNGIILSIDTFSPNSDELKKKLSNLMIKMN